MKKLGSSESYRSYEYAMNEAKWYELYEYECRQKLKIVIQLIWTVWIDFQNWALREFAVKEGEEKESQVFTPKNARITHLYVRFCETSVFYNFLSPISRRGSTRLRPQNNFFV